MENLMQNNSNEMKTVVETFIIEETAELIYDNDKLTDWNNLVAELGLKGQENVIKKDKSPLPFMSMNSSLKNIFETLCPRKVDVELYSVTPIPLEILSLVKLSKNEGYFDMIQIWYDDKSPDPACIGMKYLNEKKYTWEMQHYLIGKWADVKQSFEELKERAVKRYLETTRNSHQQQIKQYQRYLEDLNETAFNMFGSYGFNTNTPSKSVNDDLPF